MSKVFLISVGKLKKGSEYLSLQETYLKRMKFPLIQLIETKQSGEDFKKESKEVINKINQLSSRPYIFLTDESGEQVTSTKLSKDFYHLLEKGFDLFFIIGGAMGHSTELKSMANKLLSFSKMTFPHKLARIILLEQLYRVQSIKNNHPYHNP